MRRERWINICSVYCGTRLHNIYLAGTDCTRAVCWVNWRGRSRPYDPWQFVTWEAFWKRLERKLEEHRLEMVTGIPPMIEHGLHLGQHPNVWVLVRRLMPDTTKIKLKFLGETELARHYEHPATHYRQWVPKSNCPHTTKFGDRVGDMHEVTIKDWWLEKHPFVARDAGQDELL